MALEMAPHILRVKRGTCMFQVWGLRRLGCPWTPKYSAWGVLTIALERGINAAKSEGTKEGIVSKNEAKQQDS